MSEEMAFVRIYQAQSEASDVGDGIQFQAEDRMRTFDDRHHSIEVNFASGVKRTLRFVSKSDNPPGYIVATDRPRVAGNVHLTIAEIGPRKFRVVLPDHLKSTWGG